MKTPDLRRSEGFTLIELLVVITIVVVLAAVGFTVVTSAVNRAKRAKALETIGAIETSVNHFYTDYSRMPKDITADTLIDTGDASFLNVLLGLEGNGPNHLNTRSVRFLKVSEGTREKGGLVYNSDSTSAEGLYDPWGGTFKVMLDGDLDETVTPSPPGGGGRELSGRRCAAWSNGPDGVNGGGTAADDVRSWK